MEIAFNQWRWRALRWAPRFGLMGLAGLVLALFALLTAWQIERAIQSAAQLSMDNRATAHRLETQALGPSLAPSAQLQRFHALLPSVTQVPQLLARLHQVALHNGITLNEGQFKLDVQAGDSVARYEMIFPIKAEYSATRAFLREALDALPTLALEELSFRRDDPLNPILDTRLQFALYLSVADQDRPQ